MIRFLVLPVLLALAFALAPSPAMAGPVGAAIGAVLSGIKAFAAASVLNGFLVRAAFSIGMSMLQRALSPKPQAAGLKTSVTQTGGNNPQSFILGRYATAGQLIAPPNSYGSLDKTPRAYLVYAIAIGAMPGMTVERVIIDGSYVTLGSTPDALWGLPVEGSLAGFAWIDTLDGTQAAAHPGLIDAFAADPDRPWAADMVGPGTSYVTCRFRYSRRRFNGLPAVRFQVLGIPLYDPRADDTVGGAGAQRWADPATWGASTNLVVQIYNVMRGIALPDDEVFGGGVAAEDLPLANWFAAMNECDVLTLDGEDEVPQYHGGIEVKLDDTPADVIDALLRGCAGQMVELGGIWKIRVGPPGLPVLHFTDDDILLGEAESLTPFPGLQDTVNGVQASHPEPEALWEVVDAPPRYDSALEALDGDRRLVAQLQFPAVHSGNQVQRLMQSYLLEERRFRRHGLALPPEAFVLEPLDAISWTSARNGYVSKLFELFAATDNLMTMTQALGLRERDPADYDWSAEDALPASLPLPGTTPTAAQSVPGFEVSAVTLLDGGALARRPAIGLVWDPEGAEDADGIEWEIALATGPAVLTGSRQPFSAGAATVSEGILPGTDYLVRAQLIADRALSWTGWLAVTTPAVFLGAVDLADDALVGMIDAASLAAGIKAIEVLGELPGPAHVAGRMVFLTTDSKLYRNTGSGWTVAVPASDVTGTLTNAQIADLAAAKITGTLTNAQIAELAATKLTGQITGTQITDNAITTAKLNAGAVSTAKLAAGAVTANEIAANAITTAKLNAGAVSTAKLAAGAVTANEIAADAVTAAKIGAGAVTTAKLAAGAVTANEIAANAITTGKIAAGAVSTTQLAANAVLASKVAVTDYENLFPDGTFTQQDSSLFRNFGGSGVHSFVALTDAIGGVALRHTSPAGTGSTQDTRQETPFATPIQPGRIYAFEVRIRAVSAGSAKQIRPRIIWLTSAGAVVSTFVLTTVTDLPATWTEYSGQATAPATAAFALYSVLTNDTASALDIYIDYVRLRRAGVGQLVVDGDFAVSGMTVFGGTLQSDDFVTGVSGWQLSQAGTLEIQNLIARDAIQVGAVTDIHMDTQLPEISTTSSSYVEVLISSEIYLTTTSVLLVGCMGQFNSDHAAGQAGIRFQIRYYRDGAWEAYANFLVKNSIVAGYAHLELSTTLLANAERVQFRLQYRCEGASIYYAKNCYIVVKDLTR